MKKILFIATFILSVVFATNAQEALKKAPKFVSVEMGYRYLPTTTYDIKNQGFTLLADYAWQLSGFTGKPAAYLSVPLGYTHLFGNNGASSGGILSYGWTVRHELKATGKAIPFIGYGLLLNQLRINDTPGSVFGHQTCLNAGYRFKTGKKFDLYTKLEYSYARFPHLGSKKSDSMQGVELKVGVRL